MQSPTDDAPQDPLEDLLAEALDAHETGGDAALAAFLAEHPEASPRLREALADLRGADLLHTRNPTLPDRFGEFRITGRLGAGGMGVVYLAEQSSLGREVALKVVRPELLVFDGARERFRREIETVAKLEHPAIVPILATGEAQGVPFYAMPRLRGRSGEAVLQALGERDPAALRGADLRTAVQDGPGEPMPEHGSRDPFAGSYWQACVRCVQQAALGIQHAHARGVLHRDLKPSNVMLLTDGRTVVLDFGLAQAEGDARLTRTGSAAGSPAYMAPEQLRAEPADERTDVYGLGATLYALLGLRSPFPLGDPLALRTRIAHGERQPLRGAKTLPPELLLVLDAAMDVDRGRRHASAAAFAEDLHAVLDGRPIHARALPLPVKLRRFAQRHRALAAGGVVALLFAAVTPTLLWWQQRAANTRLASAVDVSLDAVEQLLARAAASQVRYQPAMQRLAADMLEDAVALFTRLADEPEHRGRVTALRCRTLSDLGRVRLNLGQFDAAHAANTAALAAAPSHPDSAMQLEIAGVHSQLAYIAVRRGRTEELTTHLAAADAALAAALLDPRTRDSALAERGSLSEFHAKVQEDAGDLAGAIATLRRGLADLEATHKPTLLALQRFALALHLHRAGPQYDDEARQLLLAVRAIDDGGERRLAVWPPPRLQAAQAELELGTIAVDRGEHAAAQPHFTGAIERLDELVRDYPQDPTVRRLRARTANQLGNAANTAKDFARARQRLEQGLADVRIALEGNGDDESARTCRASLLRSLTTTLRELRDWDALERTARELGAPPDRRETTGRAARELLRCAEAVPARAEALRQEALALLERAAAVGLAIDANDALYAPLRDEPRFRALLKPGDAPR